MKITKLYTSLFEILPNQNPILKTVHPYPGKIEIAIISELDEVVSEQEVLTNQSPIKKLKRVD